MNDQLQHDFKDAAEEYARRLRAAKAAKESPKANTAANGELFATAMNARLEALREESGISDFTGN